MSEMLSEIWNFFSICLEAEDCSKNSSVVPKFLKILIFEQLHEKSRIASLRNTDTDTDTAIQHGRTRGHGKFKKTRIRIRQGHGIIR